MLTNKNAFWQFDENRAKAGYKSAWLVKKPNADKFSLIGLTTTVPYPFGDTESFDINVLQSSTIGKVEGKFSMENVDVPVYHHRDNAYRFNKLAGQVLEFMSINSEFVGYKFTGTLKYKPDSAEASENTATVTVTPLSGSEIPVYDARSEIIETLCIAGVIPETVQVGQTVDFSVKQPNASLTFAVKKIAPSTNVETNAVEAVDYSFTGNKISFVSTGLMAVTISADNYESWTTTVYVESAV
jgi:hypothetical protein